MFRVEFINEGISWLNLMAAFRSQTSIFTAMKNYLHFSTTNTSEKSRYAGRILNRWSQTIIAHIENGFNPALLFHKYWWILDKSCPNIFSLKNCDYLSKSMECVSTSASKQLCTYFKIYFFCFQLAFTTQKTIIIIFSSVVWRNAARSTNRKYIWIRVFVIYLLWM